MDRRAFSLVKFLRRNRKKSPRIMKSFYKLRKIIKIDYAYVVFYSNKYAYVYTLRRQQKEYYIGNLENEANDMINI